jgi:hypothetical protein
MEIYVAVSGTKEAHDRWRNDLSSHFFPVWQNGKKKQDEDGLYYNRRLLVAPIQIYKICTNKENLGGVMDILGVGENYILQRYKPLKVLASTIRKILKLKKVPKPKNPNPLMQPEQIQKAVGVIPIGIKDDFIDSAGNEQI